MTKDQFSNLHHILIDLDFINMQRCRSYEENEKSSMKEYSTSLHHTSMSSKEIRLLLFTKYKLGFHLKTLILKSPRDSLKFVLTNSRNPSDSKKERLNYIRESKRDILCTTLEHMSNQ